MFLSYNLILSCSLANYNGYFASNTNILTVPLEELVSGRRGGGGSDSRGRGGNGGGVKGYGALLEVAEVAAEM